MTRFLVMRFTAHRPIRWSRIAGSIALALLALQPAIVGPWLVADADDFPGAPAARSAAAPTRHLDVAWVGLDRGAAANQSLEPSRSRHDRVSLDGLAASPADLRFVAARILSLPSANSWHGSAVRHTPASPRAPPSPRLA